MITTTPSRATTPAIGDARPLPLLRRSLADGWRALIGWSLGLSAATLLYLPLFSNIGGNEAYQDVIASLPTELVAALGFDQLTTGAGYAQSTLYGLLGFALVTIASIGWGAAAIAHDDEQGTLELVLAHGVSRTRVLLERFAAIVIKLLVVVVIVTILVLALNGPARLNLSFEGIMAGGVALFSSGLLTAAVAILAGAVVGRSTVAVGAASGVAVVGYALNAVGNLSEQSQWLHALSPYNWAYGSSPLANGFDLIMALPYVVTAAAIGLSVIAFNRRDVGV